MVLHSSLSVLFVSKKHSSTDSLSPVKVEPIGTTRTTQLNTVTDFEDHWLSTILRTLWHTYTMLIMVSFHQFPVHALSNDLNRKHRYHALRLVSIS